MGVDNQVRPHAGLAAERHVRVRPAAGLGGQGVGRARARQTRCRWPGTVRMGHVCLPRDRKSSCACAHLNRRCAPGPLPAPLPCSEGHHSHPPAILGGTTHTAHTSKPSLEAPLTPSCPLQGGTTHRMESTPFCPALDANLSPIWGFLLKRSRMLARCGGAFLSFVPMSVTCAGKQADMQHHGNLALSCSLPSPRLVRRIPHCVRWLSWEARRSCPGR